MFIAALFVIARTWKQPRCPSADEWIRKQWYIYTMEYYSAIKKNTFESVLVRWMKLEPIIQSEVSQKEKHQYSILTHIYDFYSFKFVKVCIMTQNVVFHGEFFCKLEKNVYFAIVRVFYRCQLDC